MYNKSLKEGENDMKLGEKQAQERALNETLTEILSSNHITYVNFVAIGNSISSGFRMKGEILPLVHYNQTIQGVLTSKGISYHPYTFARYSNNNDEHVYSWLINNIKQSQMNKMIRADIEVEHVIENGCQVHEEYYPLELEENKGLADILKESKDEKATIVIYNGATGSFLDNVTRQGLPKVFSGFQRDYTSMEAVLKYIQEQNRQQGTNVQVYLCGIPNLLQQGLNDLMVNRHLQQMAEKYANVVYVPPIERRYIYHEDGKVYFDVHYDHDDYQHLSNMIMVSICQNYNKTMAMINIDREFVRLNSEKEQQLDKEVEEQMTDIIAQWIVFLEKQGIDKDSFIDKLKTYLLDRFPYDFYCLQKQNIKKI